MRIYTKTGDKGETQLIGKKVSKTHQRVEAYGTLDELNSFVGVTIVHLKDKLFNDIVDDLQKIQQELFDLGGDLANISAKDKLVKEDYVSYLESRIDKYWDEAPELKSFILPGGTQGAAYLHVCRTIARRAERRLVQIDDDFPVSPIAYKYLNRLSDFFFAAARAVNTRSNVNDVLYKSNNPK